MNIELHDFARAYFDRFFNGKLTEDLYAPDLKVWTTIGEMEDPSIYAMSVNSIMSLFAGGSGLDHTIRSIIAEDDRIVVEIEGSGTFRDGETYQNAYAFVLRLRDGKICEISEHFNPIPANEKLFPRLSVPALS